MVRARDLTLDHEHWSNPRTTTGLDEHSIGELAADMKVRGPLDPLTVQQVKLADRVINLVVDGQRRTLAAMTISGNFLLPVVDRTPEPIALDWESSDRILTDVLASFSHREGLSDYELSEVAERMKNRGRNLADIGGAIRRSPSWVSRILTGRASATPMVLTAWKQGEITTEVFKEVTSQKDPAQQETKAAAVLEASKSGNKGEARALAKEIAHEAKAKDDDAPDVKKPAPVVKGPQLSLLKDKDGKPDEGKPAPARTPMTSRHALEDLVRMAAKRPPMHELIKGIVLGVRYALGEIEPDSFGKPWISYLERAGGELAKKHLPVKAAKSKPARKLAAKAAKPKAARKPAKKSKKSKR